jgi:arylsulfatase A-like enzyme
MPQFLTRASAGLVAIALCSSIVAAAERPNVLFIAVDDLNDWIGCLGGHPQCKTPNIDRLASRGVLFERAYCTAPACNPSRASLLTGLRPSTTGVYLNSQPWRPAVPEAVTLPQHFMQHGYRVTGCGKIFHGSFEERASWHEYLKKGGDPQPSEAVRKDPHSRAGGIIWGVLDAEDAEMGDAKIVDHAIEQLEQTHDKPFFLACGLARPHMPWQVPRKYYDMYPLDSIVLPKVRDDDLDDVPEAGLKMARPQGDHKTVVDTENWRHAVQAYLATITFADGQIGRLLDALDQSRYADNTIVILWGDHGWHLGEKHHWRKFSLWEEATRAPLMVAAPGITKPGTRCGRTVDFVHIYPTLVELCGLPAREGLDGRSFVPLLRDPDADWNLPAITTHGRNNHAVRSERWRYIRYADGSEELYDHKADPLEWTNLAGDEKTSDVRRQLTAMLPEKNALDAEHQRRQGGGKKAARKKAKQAQQ